MADISKIKVPAGASGAPVEFDVKDATARSSIPAASSSLPSAPGTAAAGTSTNYARADHVHPPQTTLNGHTLEANVPSDAVFTDTWNAMTGATSSTNGTAGYVPAPPSNGYNTKYLRADGSWGVPEGVLQLQLVGTVTPNSGNA